MSRLRNLAGADVLLAVLILLIGPTREGVLYCGWEVIRGIDGEAP